MIYKLVLIGLMAVGSAMGASFSFSSNFEGGNTEGWTIYTTLGNFVGGTGPTAPTTGGVGNSGFLQAEDTANGYLFFIAPALWSGDLYGGTLSFSLRNQNPNTYRNIGYLGDPVVMVTGSGGPNLYALGLPGANLNWTYNQIQFAEGPNWSTSPYSMVAPTPAQVAATLTSVTSIGILADWVSGYYGKPGIDYGHDITGLDAVALTSSVPEPGTVALLAGGLAVVLALRRRVA